MFIKDFTADVSTLNFGTDKDTKAVHEKLHAKGITTISELCHLSKKNIEALEFDPVLIELHLKKNGLSLGMSDEDILQHQFVASKLITTNSDMESADQCPEDSRLNDFSTSLFKLDADWSERYFELAKALFLSDHSILRSREKKMKRAILSANRFILMNYSVGVKLLDNQKEQK